MEIGDGEAQQKLEAIEELKKLRSVEEHFLIPSTYSDDQSLVCRRQQAVAFIEKVCKFVNFDVSVPYLAMAYFDRFISVHKVPMVLRNKQKNEELFMVSCLALAWMLKVCSYDLNRFLLEQELSIDEEELVTMLELIQQSLQYGCRDLTPLCFARRFFTILSEPPTMDNQQAIYQLIVWVQADIRFTKFKPSVLAAAAVSCVVSFPELFDCDFLNQGEVNSCRSLFIEVIKDRSVIPFEDAWLEYYAVPLHPDEVRVDIDEGEALNGNMQNQMEREQANPLVHVKLEWSHIKPKPPRWSFYQWLASGISGICGVLFSSATDALQFSYG